MIKHGQVHADTDLKNLDGERNESTYYFQDTSMILQLILRAHFPVSCSE